MKNLKSSIYSTLIVVLLSTNAFSDCSYELFSISSTKEAKVIDFIEQLSDECEFSVVVTDSFTEKFLNTTLNKTHINNLTLDEVLNIILTQNNLSYNLENNILKISYLRTRVFGIDYILSQRKSTGSTDITLSSSNQQQNSMGMSGSRSGSSMSSSSTGTSGGIGMNQNNRGSSAESGSKIESTDEVVFWKELDLELQRVLNRPEDEYKSEAPIINKNAGLITVTATYKQLKRLEAYLKSLQSKIQLQVLIDVQLLSVTMSKGKSTGIDWQQLYALQNMEVSINAMRYKNVSTFENDTITEAFYNGGKDIASLVTVKGGGSLKEVIKFLQTQGDVTSISNPKVLTLNNQPALITAGTEYFYKIQQSTNQQGTGGGVAATTQNETVQSVFAGVLLDITPEIADDRTITLKINPSLSETKEDMVNNTSSERNMPPDLNRRQLSSVVTVKDGHRIILGGLINSRNTIKSSKVPILGDIPGLSYFFKYEETVKQVEELVIVIEPHIISKDSNELSLSDLGYEGITDETITMDKSTLKNNSDTVEDEDNEI